MKRSLEKVVNLSSIELDLDNTQELIELASSENDYVVMGEIAFRFGTDRRKDIRH